MNSALKTVVQWFCIAAVVLAASAPSLAQRREDPVLPRNQTGGVASQPNNGVFQVISIDSYNRAVQMQGSGGSPFTVYVGEDIYDISKLKPGDRIQVNFLVPDGLGDPNKLKAANIWPAN